MVLNESAVIRNIEQATYSGEAKWPRQYITIAWDNVDEPSHSASQSLRVKLTGTDVETFKERKYSVGWHISGCLDFACRSYEGKPFNEIQLVLADNEQHEF